MLHDIDEIDFEIWPPTLAYYTGYEEKDVSILARSMVEQLSKCLRQAACAGGKESICNKVHQCGIPGRQRGVSVEFVLITCLTNTAIV